ncbi:MAG: hypothetical protein NT106_01205 [Candidatus Sumerlaeota bacterium]|nr:hypothetical protein [Candidatus Sumerlaeota bacterium]
MGSLKKIALFKQGFGLFIHQFNVETDKSVSIQSSPDQMNEIQSSLTVLDMGGGHINSIACENDNAMGLFKINLQGSGTRTVQVLYVVSTPPWEMTYRLMVPDQPGKARGLLQGMAIVHRTGAEPWENVDLTLKSARPHLNFETEKQEDGMFYEYHIPHPVSVSENGYVMIPVMDESVDCENILVFHAPEQNIYPTVGIILSNTTSNPLAPGPITIFQKDAFGGQSLLPTLHPGQRHLLCYANTQECEVRLDQKPGGEAVREVRIKDGELILELDGMMMDTYEIQNRTTRKKEMVIEHPRMAGQKLQKPRNPFESTEKAWRFRISVPPDIAIQFQIESTIRDRKTIRLAEITGEHISALVAKGYLDEGVEKQLRGALSIRDSINQKEMDNSRRSEQERAFQESLQKISYVKDMSNPVENNL